MRAAFFVVHEAGQGGRLAFRTPAARRSIVAMSPRLPTRQWLLPRRWLGATALLALAGCGGGFYLGDNFDDDDPPQVLLVVSPDTAAPGEEVRLRASASDDSGIEEVIFFRVDGAVSTRLDTDETAPYELIDELPDGATGTVQFFARAVDNDGQSRDSDLFSVSVDR